MKSLKYISFALALGFSVLGSTYVLNGPKWPSSSVNYYINPNNSEGLSLSAVISDMQAGAATWTLQTQANIRYNYMGQTSLTNRSPDGKNVVYFANYSNGGLVGEAMWWADASGRLTDCDVEFYGPSYVFFTSDLQCSGGIYLPGFVAHEMGHCLGLGHSADSTATMYPTGHYCDSTDFPFLAPDDIAAIEALYPGGSPTATPAGTPPLSPSNLTSFGLGYTTVSLSWTDNSSNEQGFVIERSTDQASWSQSLVNSGATTFNDSGLTSDRDYYYRVKAYNSYGESGYTNLIGIHTPAINSPPQMASAPSPTNGSTGISTTPTLAWASATGATSYDIYFGTSSTPSLAISNTGSNSYSPGSLAAGTTYYWRVDSVNTIGVTSGPTWSFTTKIAKAKGRRR